ncbi:alpha/beta fold hydrolase [Paenibacillus woosongensis]|uniref:Alpha/beta fold hydrolase n=1 Tax=Paenibacillus woosongensis TaxID=307580 RepID=A0A7X3CPG0_9BACL|nr:alpha/beta hydrolase [Paenibacillus woosongensis]MUG46859.1 alpha/beta fold hydrolase [Paenibacillus woosongensis]
MPESVINGYRMHYIDRGKGTAIVFIHPPVLTSTNFQYQIQQLSGQFRTVAFDIRGHGRSGPSEASLTYRLIAEDIKKLMDELTIEKACLCGYSTGGSIVLEFLLTYPDRALGGIIIGGMSEVSDRKLRNRIFLASVFSRVGAVGALALTIAWRQARMKLSLMRRLYIDAKKGNSKNAKQYYQYSLGYNCTAQLGQIPHPVLLVYGEKDKHFYRYARLLQQQLPNNELVFIPQVSHQIPTKEAGSLNRLIQQFLDNCSPS